MINRLDMIKSSYFSEEYLKSIGFEREKMYNHDQYTTTVYKNSPLILEKTFEGNKLVYVQLCIGEDITIENPSRIELFFLTNMLCFGRCD